MKFGVLFAGVYSCIMIALFVTFFQLVMKLKPNPKDMHSGQPPANDPVPDEPPEPPEPPPPEVDDRRAGHFENEVMNELFGDVEGIPVYRERTPEHSKESSNFFGNRTSNKGQFVNINETRYVVLTNDADTQLKNIFSDNIAVIPSLLKTSKRGFSKRDNNSIVFKIVSSDGDPTIEIKIIKPVSKKIKKRKSRRAKVEKKRTENVTTTTVLPTTSKIMANNFVIQVLPNNSLYLDTPNLYEDNNNSSQKLFGKKGIIIDNVVEIKPL